MNIGDYGALGQAIFSTGVVQTQLNTLTEQASSGYVAANYGGLGAGVSTAISLQPQITSLSAQQSAIDTISGQQGVAQTALTQISTIASNINALIPTLTNINPGQVTYVASAAKSALQQIVSLLDTTDGSTYVFAGTDSSNPPVPNPSAVTSAPFFTQAATAVQGLGANGNTTLASVVSALENNSPFSTNLQSGTASSLTATVQLGSGAAVPTGILANQNTLIPATTTANSTGSYTQDIIASLATLANLSSSQVNTAGFVGLVQGTQTLLAGAISDLGSEAGSLGDVQSDLTAQQTELGESSTALSAQVSSVEDTNMTQTISDISEVQTQLTASYKLISELKSLSLANYL